MKLVEFMENKVSKKNIFFLLTFEKIFGFQARSLTFDKNFLTRSVTTSVTFFLLIK